MLDLVRHAPNYPGVHVQVSMLGVDGIGIGIGVHLQLRGNLVDVLCRECIWSAAADAYFGRVPNVMTDVEDADMGITWT